MSLKSETFAEPDFDVSTTLVAAICTAVFAGKSAGAT
jgi:hypothetical protein